MSLFRRAAGSTSAAPPSIPGSGALSARTASGSSVFGAAASSSGSISARDSSSSGGSSSSPFVRASSSNANVIPGTKRWIDGQLLVSTGHAELDAICGGGVAVGSLVLLEQDYTHAHADTLCQLFVAEGVSTGHGITVVAHDKARADAFVEALPLNVSRDSQDVAALNDQKKAAATTAADSAGPSAASSGARVAISSKFCHTFDLNGRMTNARAAGIHSLTAAGHHDNNNNNNSNGNRNVHDEAGNASTASAPVSARRGSIGSNLLLISHALWRLTRCPPLDSEIPIDRRPLGLKFRGSSGLSHNSTRFLRSVVTADESAPLEIAATRAVYRGLVNGISKALNASTASSTSIHRLVMLGFGEPGSWPGYSTSSSSSSSSPSSASAHQHHETLIRTVQALRSIVKGSLQFPAATTATTPGQPQQPTLRPGVISALRPSSSSHGAGAPGPIAAAPPPALPKLPIGGATGTEAGATFITALAANTAAAGAGASTAISSSFLQPPSGGAVLVVTAALHHLPVPVANRIRSFFDTVLKVHAFTDPPAALAMPTVAAANNTSSNTALTAGTAPEFSDFHGLLMVRKVLRPASVASVPTDTVVYCFKRDRRKLVIEKPHLPPEDDRTATAPVSAGGTGTATTAGLGAAARMQKGTATISMSSSSASSRPVITSAVVSMGVAGRRQGQGQGPSSSSHDGFGVDDYDDEEGAGGEGEGAHAGAGPSAFVMTNTDGSRQTVSVESDEMDANLPTDADIAAMSGGGGGGLSCATSGGRGPKAGDSGGGGLDF